MRWRLILEEYSPKLIYVKGENKVGVDALSRLDLKPATIEPSLDQMAELFGLDDNELPVDALPLQYKAIAREQNRDKNLLKLLNSNTQGYHIKALIPTRRATTSKPFVEAERSES